MAFVLSSPTMVYRVISLEAGMDSMIYLGDILYQFTASEVATEFQRGLSTDPSYRKCKGNDVRDITVTGFKGSDHGLGLM